MAIAVDGNTVAAWNLTAAGGTDDPTGTSASFTPPDGSLLVVTFGNDTNGGGTTPTISVSGGSLSWTNRASRGDDEGTGGIVGIYTAPVVTGASMTVTVTLTNVGGSPGGSTRGGAKCWIVTGHDVSTPVTQANENSSTTNSITTTALTPDANGKLFTVGGDWNALGTPASSTMANGGSDSGTNPSAHTNAFYSWIHGHRAVSSGVSAGNNIDASGGSAADWNWVNVIIREAAGGGGPTVKSLAALGVG